MPKVDFVENQKPPTVKQIKISTLFTVYSSDGRERSEEMENMKPAHFEAEICIMIVLDFSFHL